MNNVVFFNLLKGEKSVRRGIMLFLFIIMLFATSPVVAKVATLNGTLTINSTPSGAVVQINNTYKGETPLTLTLKPGTYNITVSTEDLANSTLITLKPNEKKTLQVTLTPTSGNLFINSTPVNASVYINGRFAGFTPLGKSLPAGTYVINVTKKSYEANCTTVTIVPGKEQKVSLILKPVHESFRFPWAVLLLIFATLGGAGYYLFKSRAKRFSERSEKGKICTFDGTEESFKPSGEKSPEIIKVDKACGVSHVGARDKNEDNLLIERLSDAYLLAVADGVGGHRAGEVASKIAVDTLKDVFAEGYKRGMSTDKIKTLLMNAYERAHERIKSEAIGKREGMGTTLVSAFVRKGKVIAANTGDSRAYLMRGGKILKRTRDHSLVQQLLDEGTIGEEEVKNHPMRNVITKALGIDFGVDFYEWELEKGDVLLLSSDGLHDYVDESKMVEISLADSAGEVLERMMGEALKVTKDNVTIAVFKG